MKSATTAATADVDRSHGLFLRTPLIRSAPLSELVGTHDVYLKLDCLQPSGSFKDRGMAHLCHTLQTTKGTQKLIASSGGNAGLAVATVGRQLPNVTVSVVVPESTKPHVIAKLQSLRADVTVHGKIWNEADLLARQRVDEDPQAEYVSPYDNPLLWTGHSTLVDEIVQDLLDNNDDDDDDFYLGAMIVSVGGGGLICGVLEGLERHGSKTAQTKVIACETEGAASFGTSWNQNGGKETIRLDAIASIATSLGALQVTEVALERAHKHQQNDGSGAGGGIVEAAICTDKEAVEACLQFSADHRILVEPACGAGLAALYSERLRPQTLSGIPPGRPVVVEICGGSGVTLELLDLWKQNLGIV